MEAATRLGCTTLPRTRVFSLEGDDSQRHPCDSAPRHHRFGSVVCLPGEVLVRGRYVRAPHGQVWSETLVDARCYGGGHPISCGSLEALPVDPVQAVEREERASRISPWHLAGADSGGTDKEWQMVHAKEPYPSRSTPFRVAFCPQVTRGAAIRGLFGGALHDG